MTNRIVDVLQLAAVHELQIPENFAYSEGVIVDLLKFAKLCVNGCKGRMKRVTKGDKQQ